MSSYSVTRSQQGRGYRVDVIARNGARHTMLGFDTEDEASSWIEADRRRERLAQSSPILDDAD